MMCLGLLVALLIILSAQSQHTDNKVDIENTMKSKLIKSNNNNLKEIIAKNLIR